MLRVCTICALLTSHALQSVSVCHETKGSFTRKSPLNLFRFDML